MKKSQQIQQIDDDLNQLSEVTSPAADAGNLALELFPGAAEYPTQHQLAIEDAARGWSVVPLIAKDKPAVAWKPYQTKRPTVKEFWNWFVVQGHTARGIVLGRISRLAVLDIDDPAALDALRAYPHLLNTYTVRSGLHRLPHLYYRLPKDLLDTPARKKTGLGCFLASGRYVVAAGSTIGGNTWELANDADPYTLTPADLPILLAAIGIRPDAPDAGPHLFTVPKPLTGDELAAHYRQQRARTGSRNTGLFQTALIARGAGWSEYDTLSALAGVFVPDGAPPEHKPETEAQRYTEAERTIKSAFGYRHDQKTDAYIERGAGLPNSAREKLLQTGHISTARALDALFIQRVQPGQTFTEKDAVTLCKNIGLGRSSVRQALALIKEIESSGLFDLAASQTARAAANASDAPLSERGNFVSDFHPNTAPAYNTMYCNPANSRQNSTTAPITAPMPKRGRPAANLYTMPPIEALCAFLDVSITPADALTAADLKSSKTYRVALQKAFTARNPGKPVSRSWQAARLGVTKRSVIAYDHAAGIQAVPNIQTTPVTFSNIDSFLPHGTPPELLGGCWLTIEGQRVKPSRSAALAALSRKKRVEFCRMGANSYYLSKDAPEPSAAPPDGAENAPAVEPSAAPEKPHHDAARGRKRHVPCECGACGHSAAYVLPARCERCDSSDLRQFKGG